MLKITIGTFISAGDYVITDETNVLACAFLEHSKTKAKAIAASFGSYTKLRVNGKEYGLTKGWQTIFKPVRMPHDSFVYTVMLSKSIGKSVLFTKEGYEEQDVFHFLMGNYKMPLLKEWSLPILEELILRCYVKPISDKFIYQRCGLSFGVPLYHELVQPNELIVYDFSKLKEKDFEKVVSDLLKKGCIYIADRASKPLRFKGLDEYLAAYGKNIVENLQNQIETLNPLNGELAAFAAKHKRMFPQQAARVNGLVSLKQSGSSYGLEIEGMGCGKTFQSIAVVEEYFNEKWLKEHPGKSLRDLYLSDDQPKYRNIIMAPSYLVEKWKEEILSEIPGTEVEVIKSFSQLVKLREEGKERNGRKWYILSKDYCKLGSMYSPIPSVVASKVPVLNYCKDCYEEDSTLQLQVGVGNKARCPRCNGRHFIRLKASCEPKRGMVCPKCGNVLLKRIKNIEELSVLTPGDFAKRSSSNSICMNCGEQLWGVDAKPITNGQEVKKPKWYKISHFTSYTMKSRTTAFVLKNHENDYYVNANFPQEDVHVVKREYGPRRTAPSQYIKKYLKGYFDFAILDEVHKYEGAGTAQANAAHALIKASNFTLGLSGTIANGKADSFFYLLYMLDPARMRAKGFEYTDVLSFSKYYGSIETVYESAHSKEVTYNSCSRGRQISSPKVVPGISPLLFIDFLVDKSVFLDLHDMSDNLPPYHEYLELLDLPTDILNTYHSTLQILKSRAREEGKGVLSSMLQFGLSYPDKVYGRQAIMSPNNKGICLATVKNYEEYAGDVLLPKEERLIAIINKEQAEGRNCFVYTSFTGNAEMNISERLKKLIEKRCDLEGHVCIMQSVSPKAEEREAWIHKKAADGTKVFLCNPKLVETGLDFCFTHKGKFYNYPTIIFYQVGYELSVLWQSSSRAYRLIQSEECRTYWMAYNNTLQAAALQIMAEKKVATSAIQGKFSADGLASMAKGVDPRVRLAQMLAQEDMASKEELSKLFRKSSEETEVVRESYLNVPPAKTWYEVMDMDIDTCEKLVRIIPTEVEGVDVVEPILACTQFSILDFVSEVRDITSASTRAVIEGRAKEEENLIPMVASVADISTKTKKKTKRISNKKQQHAGQGSLLDFFSAEDDFRYGFG